MKWLRPADPVARVERAAWAFLGAIAVVLLLLSIASSANYTSIVVAHRLSTIQRANQIIVLHHGEIREQGTHQELLAHHGLYWKLYKLQYADGTGSGSRALPADDEATLQPTGRLQFDE